MIEELKKILRGVSKTRETEYTCDEAYRFFDELAEAVARGEDLEGYLPEVQHHLEMCPECREDFEALVDCIEGVSKEDVSDI